MIETALGYLQTVPAATWWGFVIGLAIGILIGKK